MTSSEINDTDGFRSTLYMWPRVSMLPQWESEWEAYVRNGNKPSPGHSSTKIFLKLLFCAR